MLLNAVLNLLFPPVCPVCRQRVGQSGVLCPQCFSRLQFFTASNAKRAAAVVYNDISKDLVLGLKYADKTELAALMGRMMVQAGKQMLNDADLIVSVPLHRKRLFVRKYNQAALLANVVSEQSGIEHNPFVLKRIKMTGKQSTRQKRFENVNKAFEFNAKTQVRGKKVVLVDDVMTTGATAFACAAVLLAAGAKEVRVLVFAKAVRD